MHFYPGYTVATMLALPWAQLTALLAVIPGLQAEADLRALQVAAVGANPGERGRGYRELAQRLTRLAQGQAAEPPQTSTLQPGVAPGVSYESEPGSIKRERERQRAAAERIAAEQRGGV